MNKPLSLSLLASVIASGAIVAIQPAAHAASFSFDAQDVLDGGCTPNSRTFNNVKQFYGGSSCTVNDFFTLTASTSRNGANPALTVKELTKVVKKNTEVFALGIGVDSSNPQNGEATGSQGEIDFDELLHVGFKKLGVVSKLDLNLLYRPGVYADEVFEVALATADGGTKQGTLTVTGQSSAVWSLGGTVINLSPSSQGSGGAYQILNPFGDLKVTGFSLTAVRQFAKDKNGNLLKDKKGNPYYPQSYKNSDFTLSSVEVTKVPEPATLLGLGVVGLAAFTRRRTVKAE
ncbi:hypothetical protein LEP3755_31770 [Leptolyngbya sp. NIES-3755]|nr:hypothetical protein LEP3755_31770 [Leptolyngbya sp. NIES-3755]